MTSVDRIITIDGIDDFAVDLFPYKIKKRSLFYNRNHPVNLDPESLHFQKYWREQLENYCKGRWIKDVDTWVYMYPELDFYINYCLIVDADRKRIPPRLRDNEWIMSTYGFCADGFSGFKLDKEFTCNFVVKMIEDGEEVPQWLYDMSITKYDKKEDGTFKKFVDPWVYLTEHYLITNKAERPLGEPLFQNQYANEIILAARELGKSFYKFVGCLQHKWCTNEARNLNEIKETESDMIFGVASNQPDALSRSLAAFNRAYENMPGQYKIYDTKRKEYITYKGPLYKQIQGSFDPPGEIKHIFKNSKGQADVTGNQMQFNLITNNTKKKLFTGDRFKAIVFEEFGFIKNLDKVLSPIRDSLKVGKKKTGKFIGLGTAGEMDAIEEPKHAFENPEAYQVFAVPNYFDRGNEKKIALFLPAYYSAEELKDDQGNTKLKEALLDVLKNRVKLRKDGLSSQAFSEHIMYNPIYPKEMLRPTTKGLLPVQELSEHRGELMSSGALERVCRVGAFKWNFSRTSGVSFERDLSNEYQPILEWGRDKELQDKRGAWLLFEDVIDKPPNDLYHILYDPVARSGEGTSLNSILVYKNSFEGQDTDMMDNIVAEKLGREDELRDSYEDVIRAAKYFNAKIFVESNANHFIEWCRNNNYLDFLRGQPRQTISEITGRVPKVTPWAKGCRMDKQLGDKCYLKLSDWLKRTTMETEEGLPLQKKLQQIKSPRILDELIKYDPDRKTEFDHVSSLYLLMVLKTELENVNVRINLDDDEDGYEKYDYMNIPQTESRLQYSEFLDY